MEEQNFVENELVIFSKQTIDLFLKEKNFSDIIAVYTFYYYTAKWQKTNKVKATDGYVMKGIHMGAVSFKRAKQFLLDNGLITQITTRNKKGEVTGWYIKLNYIWSKKKVESLDLEESPLVLDTTSGEKETNALSANNINALNVNILPESSETEIKPIITLPITRGKSPVMRLLSIYCSLFIDKFGVSYKGSVPMTLKQFKDLLVVYSELQLAALLIVYFNWKGMAGDNFKDQDFLCSIAFPPTAFRSSISKYEVYARNVMGMPFDDDEKLLPIVGTHFKTLKGMMS